MLLLTDTANNSQSRKPTFQLSQEAGIVFQLAFKLSQIPGPCRRPKHLPDDPFMAAAHLVHSAAITQMHPTGDQYPVQWESTNQIISTFFFSDNDLSLREISTANLTQAMAAAKEVLTYLGHMGPAAPDFEKPRRRTTGTYLKAGATYIGVFAMSFIAAIVLPSRFRR